MGIELQTFGYSHTFAEGPFGRIFVYSREDARTIEKRHRSQRRIMLFRLFDRSKHQRGRH
jgi:hypothetical protein